MIKIVPSKNIQNSWNEKVSDIRTGKGLYNYITIGYGNDANIEGHYKAGPLAGKRVYKDISTFLKVVKAHRQGENGLPKRDFLKMGMEHPETQKLISDLMFKAHLSLFRGNKESYRKQMNRLGSRLVVQCRKILRRAGTNTLTSIQDRTIQRKRGYGAEMPRRPMYGTGTMINALSYQLGKR